MTARVLALVATLCAVHPLAAQESASGVVTEAGTGAPVAGAAVQVGPVATTTDESGRWRAAVGAGARQVRVRHPGYAPAEATLVVPGELRTVLTARPLRMETLVATASRRLQTLGEAPVATEVVGRARIAASGATDLAGVLAMVPGVEMQGGHPVGTGVYLQGLGSERVLVLVDGHPVVGRISGEIDLSRLPVNDVERVEIVKGPQSTLYGSEAMGGVINIVTRAPRRGAPAGGVRVTGGSQARRDAAGYARAATGPLEWTARGGLRDVDLVSGQNLPVDAGSRRRDANGRVAWQATPAGRVEVAGWWVDEHQQWRTSQLYNFTDNTQWSGRATAAWRAGRHRITPTLYLAGFEHALSQATGPRPVGGGSREVQRLAEAELLYSAAFGAVMVDGGAELRQDWTRSGRVVGGERDQSSTEVFGQGTWTAGAVSVVPGVRASHSSRWGDHLTPRLAAVWRPTAALALRASAGQGFRAPSFKELYMDFLNDNAGYTVRGDPELQPESSTSYSAGAEWAASRFYIRASAFRTGFDQFIETVLDRDASTDNFSVYRYRNVSEGSTAGTELQAGAALGGLRADGGWSWLRTRNEGTGGPLFGRPEHSLRGSLTYARPSGLRAGLTASYTGRTAENADAGEIEYRDAFTRLDARVARRIAAGFTAAVGVDNLLGSGPAQWPGFTRRQTYLTLSWSAGEPAF